MKIERLTKSDFDEIISSLEPFWGERHEAMRSTHHPVYLYELGDTAFVIREEGKVIAYLWGFLAQTSATGYVHLVGVHRDHRRRGLARALYRHFTDEARRRGATRLRAMTQPVNRTSIAFHRSIGMRLLGEPNADGIPVVRDYRGPGEDRVVFEMAIMSSTAPIADV